MDAEANDETVSYEIALRVIGRHLDAEPAYHVSILEVDDGFTVRYQVTQHQTDGKTIQFSKDKLADLFVFQTAGRGLARKHERKAGMWADLPHGHQEFFRALGFALDQDGARSISLEELSEEVRVSYMHQDPNNPVRLEKRHVVLRDSDILTMVESARHRRGAKLTLVKP